MNLVRSVWGFGSSKKYWRASLIAASTASDPVYRQHLRVNWIFGSWKGCLRSPELVIKTLDNFPPVESTRSLARSSAT